MLERQTMTQNNDPDKLTEVLRRYSLLTAETMGMLIGYCIGKDEKHEHETE